MFKKIVACAVAAGLFGIVFGTMVEASESGVPNASFAAVGRSTSVPYGWVDFCNRRPEECSLGKLKPLDVRLNKSTWATMQKLNRRANDAIEPVTNLEHWGTLVDHWDYPVDGKGDCKVYALYKRKLLIEAGFPRQALLMTVVRDLEGEGHAILTVKTDRGEFVLDNLSDEIRPWDATGYTYVKRQSQDDPNVWLDLGAVRGASAGGYTSNGG